GRVTVQLSNGEKALCTACPESHVEVREVPPVYGPIQSMQVARAQRLHADRLAAGQTIGQERQSIPRSPLGRLFHPVRAWLARAAKEGR
ncbi:MAG: hypothetical protein KGR26_13575, partial [Cyanobacteria bacterium REEB65]|nr:hypothetical protein [Cyanobacteria bacterium REEB65]